MTIVVVAAGSKQAQTAAKNFPPSKKSLLVAADIPAGLYFSRRRLPYRYLYQLQPPNNTYPHAHRLCFIAAKKFFSHPSVKSTLKVDSIDISPALIDLFRNYLLVCLRDFFSLSQACRTAAANQLIVSRSFDQSVSQAVAQELRVQLKTLSSPPSITFPSLSRLKLIFHLFSHYPQISTQTILNRLFSRSKQSSQTDIVVFSNGLNLASYHSVFTALSRQHSVSLLTDQQSFSDSFYLAKYHLSTQPLNWPSTRSDIKLNLKFSSLKLPQSKWIKPATLNYLLRSSFAKLVKNWLPLFMAKHSLANQILDQSQPKLLITTHDPSPSALAFVLAAKARSIPTLVLLHGSPSQDHFFFSDKQLIWGPLVKNFLTKQGIKSSRLILGGQPLFYDYSHFFQNQSIAQSKFPQLGILASGYGRNEVNQVKYFCRLLPQLAQVHPRPQINLRTHPGQIIDDLTGLAKLHGLSLRLNPPQLLEEFIARQDIIISQHSTAALAALIAQKPVIYLPASHPVFNPGSLVDQPGFFHPDYDQVAHLVQQLVDHRLPLKAYHQAQKKFVRQYCGPINSRLGVQLANKIVSVFKL